MFLINIYSFSAEIKDKQIFVNTNKCYITEQIDKKSNFLKDYGVLFTLGGTIIVFIINRFYVKKEKKKVINEIKNQLISIQAGILKEVQNTIEVLEDIDKNKGKKIGLVSVVPGKDSTKLDLMYKSYAENINKKDIEYLDNLYFINSKYRTVKEHLLKYLSNNNNVYDLLAADTIIKIVKKEIENLKF